MTKSIRSLLTSLFLASVLMVCLVFSVSARAAVNYQLIVTTEDPALSGIPQQIEVASDLGAVYFINGDGVYSSNGEGSPELLVELGTQALGVDAGVNYNSILDFSVGEGGEIAFAATLTGDGVNATNDQGVWAPRALVGPILHTTRVNTYLDLAVREGGQAPDFPEGVTYFFDTGSLDTYTRMSVGPSGRVALRGNLIGSGINSTNNEAIWLGYANSLMSVVQTGDTPSDSNGVTISDIDNGQTPFASSDSFVAFSSRLSGPNASGWPTASALWVTNQAAPRLVFQGGDPAPGTPAHFASAGFPQFRIRTNRFGHVAFVHGTWEGVAELQYGGVWLDRGNGPESVAVGRRIEDTEPGFRFWHYFDHVTLNDSGDVGFIAQLQGGDVDLSNDGSIWVGDTESVQLVAREGNQAPGTELGVVFDSLPGRRAGTPAANLDDTDPVRISAGGQLAFRALVGGTGVNLTNRSGLWATAANGALFLVAREGDMIDLDGSTKTFGSLAQGAFDWVDEDSLMFRVDFTDGTQAILRATLVPGIPTLSVFFDVQPDHWAFSFIETLFGAGISAGCGNDNYCPDNPVTRAQMAVFLERGMNGSGFSPPAASGHVFLDVDAGDFAASFIEQLASDGITAGCGNNNYCPDAEVTRAQMAVFLLRAKYGAGYSPPAPTGVFDDVNLSYWAVDWIEQLAVEGITAGCGGGNYCPDSEVTRDQMAVFLVRTFGL